MKSPRNANVSDATRRATTTTARRYDTAPTRRFSYAPHLLKFAKAQLRREIALGRAEIQEALAQERIR